MKWYERIAAIDKIRNKKGVFGHICANSTFIAFRENRNGTLNYFNVCKVCNLRLDRVDYNQLSLEQRDAAVLFDENGRKHWWNEQYDEYLKTQDWAEKRKKVFRRADNICEGCGIEVADSVHHLTYDRVGGDEMLFDLVAICSGCHEKVHGSDEKL